MIYFLYLFYLQNSTKYFPRINMEIGLYIKYYIMQDRCIIKKSMFSLFKMAFCLYPVYFKPNNCENKCQLEQVLFSQMSYNN
jgi:hypothetical protein